MAHSVEVVCLQLQESNFSDRVIDNRGKVRKCSSEDHSDSAGLYHSSRFIRQIEHINVQQFVRFLGTFIYYHFDRNFDF